MVVAPGLAVLLWTSFFACGRPPMGPVEVHEDDVAWHRAAEARADELVPDPARGGPAVKPSASPLPPFTDVDRATARYVGVDVCGGCHADALAKWSTTGHARAWEALQAKEASHDPKCVRCHVQGLGHPGGFGETLPTVAATVDLREVGCEACHGPGSDHVKAPSAGYGRLPEDGAACVACHTIEQSPDFRWDERWVLVEH